MRLDATLAASYDRRQLAVPGGGGGTRQPEDFLSATNAVTSDVAATARKLVATDLATSVAAGTVQACEQLSRHLARIVGEMGVRTLLARSATLTSARFPWLASAIPRTAAASSPWAALGAAMESQDPQTASDAFVDLLATFIDLLGRLIGDALVARLLHELWPEVFPSPDKGPP